MRCKFDLLADYKMSNHSAAIFKHSVRFPDGQNDDCNKIHVVEAAAPDADVEIHAGFFKADHKYEISLNMENKAGLDTDAKFEASSGSHFTLKQLQVKTSAVSLTIEYFPLLDGIHGVVSEPFKIVSLDGTRELKAIFRAEVLGQGQGTPMLKDGVRCIQRPLSSTSYESSH